MKLRAPVVKKSIYSKKKKKKKTDMKTHPTDKIRQQLLAMPFWGDKSVILTADCSYATLKQPVYF